MVMGIAMQVAVAATPAQTQGPARLDLTDPDSIIVYGQRLESDLAACLARACPPREDVEAATRAAVFQFSAGRYRDATTTLRRAIARNREHEAELPGQVSALHATLSTVQRHNGYALEMTQSARASVEVLRRQIGDDHPGTLREELVLGDTLMRREQLIAATTKYRHVAEMAEAGGHATIAAVAYLRIAYLAIRRERFDQARLAMTAAERVGGANPDIRLQRMLLRLRRELARGDTAAIDQQIAALNRRPRSDLQLVYSPPYPDFRTAPSASVLAASTQASGALRFADIGFWVREDGGVEDVEYLRGQHLGIYQKALLAQVAGRRYAPFTAPDGAGGVYRVERVTVRGKYYTHTRSRIAERSDSVQVEVADMTETWRMSRAAATPASPTPAPSAPGASAGVPAP